MAGNTNFPQGTKENPIPYAYYSFLSDNHKWRGAWCVDNNNRIFYVSRDGFNFFEESDNLGRFHCPVSFEIYNEMHQAGIWTGGFVRMDNMSVEYMETDIIFPDGFNSSSEESSSSGSEASGSSGSSESEESSSSSPSSNRDPIDSSSWLEEGSIDKISEIGAGSFLCSIIDDEYNFIFDLRFTCTSGKFNHTTNTCTSQMTVTLENYRSFGNNYQYEGSFHGTAAWFKPPMISFSFGYECVKLSDSTILSVTESGVYVIEDSSYS